MVSLLSVRNISFVLRNIFKKVINYVICSSNHYCLIIWYFFFLEMVRKAITQCWSKIYMNHEGNEFHLLWWCEDVEICQCIYLQIHLSNTKRFTVSLYFLCFVFPEIVLFNFNLVFIQLFKTTIPFVIIINSQWSLRDDFVIIYYYTKNDINLEIPGNGLFRFNSL